MNTISQAVAATPRLVSLTGVAGFIFRQAKAVAGKPFEDWPQWSPLESTMVALVLDDREALQAQGLNMLEAARVVINAGSIDLTVLWLLQRELRS